MPKYSTSQINKSWHGETESCVRPKQLRFFGETKIYLFFPKNIMSKETLLKLTAATYTTIEIPLGVIPNYHRKRSSSAIVTVAYKEIPEIHQWCHLNSWLPFRAASRYSYLGHTKLPPRFKANSLIFSAQRVRVWFSVFNSLWYWAGGWTSLANRMRSIIVILPLRVRSKFSRVLLHCTTTSPLHAW